MKKSEKKAETKPEKVEKVEKVEGNLIPLWKTELLINDLNELSNQNIKLYTRLDIKAMIRQLEAPFKDFADERLAFFKEHGTKNKDGSYSLNKDVKKELIEELNKMAQKEIEFHFLLKKEDLEKVEGNYPFNGLLELL